MLRDFKYTGSEDDRLKSLHGCLVHLAEKVLPNLTVKAQLHTQCFKALQEASVAAAAAAKPSRKIASKGVAPVRSGSGFPNLHAAMDSLMKELGALESDDSHLVDI